MDAMNNETDQGSVGTNYQLGKVPIASEEETRYRLSVPEGTLLTTIVEKGKIDTVTYTNGMDQEIADTVDQCLANLIHYRFVELKGQYAYPTKAGLAAADRRIAVVYPFGANMTITGYNNSLRTQTPSAKNAFLKALATEWRSWFENSIDRRALDSLFRGFMDTGVFKRLSKSINVELHDKLKEVILYYAHRVYESSTVKGAEIIQNELEFWNSKFDEYCQAAILDANTKEFVLNKSATFNDYEVLGIQVDGNNIYVNVKDVLTGNGKQMSFYDLPSETKKEVLRQIT